MSLSSCKVSVDSNGRELAEHGSSAFPIACYHDDLSKNEVPWHWHEELEAAIITEGTAIVAAGTQKYIIHPGEGIFINSGILHGAWDVNFSASRIHSIVFHPRLVSGSTDSIFHQKYVSPLIHNIAMESLFLSPAVLWQKRILDTIENTWQACFHEPFGHEFTVRNQLSELLFQIHCNYTSPKLIIDQGSIRNSIRIKQMLQFIHDNYTEELNVFQIANSASIGSSECLRCFKNTIGTTPIQYLRKYRLQCACQLLLSTESSINDIASQCGFHDLSYFIKTFREYKGETPGEYRRSQMLK